MQRSTGRELLSVRSVRCPRLRKAFLSVSRCGRNSDGVSGKGGTRPIGSRIAQESV